MEKDKYVAAIPEEINHPSNHLIVSYQIGDVDSAVTGP